MLVAPGLADAVAGSVFLPEEEVNIIWRRAEVDIVHVPNAGCAVSKVMHVLPIDS